jgi:sirohydrochlorin ferrochelatase
MELVEAPVQEHCFLELASPSVQEGIEQCVKRGATKIAVVPVLLLTATHAKKDIPEMLEQAQNTYNQIEFSYGSPLGVQEKMVEVLIERIEEKGQITSDMTVLLVGRGSSDPDAVDDINEISSLLQNNLNITAVNPCFLAAATPKFEEILRSTVAFGASRIVILPYLLFTGILMNEIEQFVQQLDVNPEQEVIICDYIGSHKNVCELLKERVIEAMEEGKTHAAMA